METKTAFAKNLRLLRKSRNLKQSELANQIKVSMYTVSVWERGIQMPRYEMLQLLADFFSVPVSSLCESLENEEIIDRDSTNSDMELLGETVEMLFQRALSLASQNSNLAGTYAIEIKINKTTESEDNEL